MQHVTKRFNFNAMVACCDEQTTHQSVRSNGDTCNISFEKIQQQVHATECANALFSCAISSHSRLKPCADCRSHFMRPRVPQVWLKRPVAPLPWHHQPLHVTLTRRCVHRESIMAWLAQSAAKMRRVEHAAPARRTSFTLRQVCPQCRQRCRIRE